MLFSLLTDPIVSTVMLCQCLVIQVVWTKTNLSRLHHFIYGQYTEQRSVVNAGLSSPRIFSIVSDWLEKKISSVTIILWVEHVNLPGWMLWKHEQSYFTLKIKMLASNFLKWAIIMVKHATSGKTFVIFMGNMFRQPNAGIPQWHGQNISRHAHNNCCPF